MAQTLQIVHAVDADSVHVWPSPGYTPQSLPRGFSVVRLFDVVKANDDDNDDDGFWDIPNNIRRAFEARDFAALVCNGNVRHVRTHIEFVKRLGLWLETTRSLASGTILCAVDQKTQKRFIIKHQQLAPPEVSYDATPGPALTELRAVSHLNFWMAKDVIAPLFAELTDYEVFTTPAGGVNLSLSLACYGCDLTRWMRPGECRARPPSAALTGAETAASWTVSPGAGAVLATSSVSSDRQLFADILTGVLLQTFLALMQAQRCFLFTHNDLHAANVLFDASTLKQSRLYATGAGVFFMQRGIPQIRVIDFQHAVFDVRDERGAKHGHVIASRNDVFNAFAMCYDVRRLCEYITRALLVPGSPVWAAVPPLLADFLWRAGALNGDVGSPTTQREAVETVWCPYLVSGWTPEDALRHPVFNSFRVPLDTPAEVVYYERPAPQASQFDYWRRRIVCNVDDPAPDIQRTAVLQAFTAPPRPAWKTSAIAEGVRIFRSDMCGTVFAKAALCYKHSVRARAAYLLQELHFLSTVLDYFAASQGVFGEGVTPLRARAALDALSVVVHGDWYVFARPKATEFAEYHTMVREFIQVPWIRGVTTATVTMPRVDEGAFLAARDDRDLDKLKDAFTV